MSIVTRYISDLHLGHENMARRRGFKDAEEMNEHIIKMWNATVRPKDITYVLGDVSMEKSSHYNLLNRLNGTKHVVLGNHDKRGHSRELLNYVQTVSGVIYLRKHRVILSHIPIHPSELDYGYSFNVHGHVHSKTLPDSRYINVSAEVIDYTPKTMEELLNGGV